MVTIFAGKRWDISRGETVVHKGTAAYLQAIRAEIVPDTAEEVDEATINPQGKFEPQVLQPRPAKGTVDYAELSREHIARYPKIRARLAE